jgi:thiol-disulfide isomerase/thioredoxin
MHFIHLMNLAACMLFLVLPGVLCADEPKQPMSVHLEASKRFREIEKQWEDTVENHQNVVRQAKTNAERAEAMKKRPNPMPLADRCLKLYADHPETYGGAEALYWVLCNAGGTEQARNAMTSLTQGPLAKGDLRLLASLFFVTETRHASARKLAPQVYERAIREGNHPKAADLLIWVCRVTVNDPSLQAIALCKNAGDQLVNRYPDAMYLWRFCMDVLDKHSDKAWTEGHLRTILAGKNPAAGVAAASALARLLQNKDEASQSESELMYHRAMKDAGKVGQEWNQAALKLRESMLLFPEETAWIKEAKAALAEMNARGLGKLLPNLTGDDLEGKPMQLIDYRGKVVLVSFWATWCAPCMALVPHERELVKRFANRPFVLVGVNGDEELDAAKKTVKDKEITWRSFKNQNRPNETISRDVGVSSWPTLFLVDHTGVIRKRWAGAPPAEVLDQEIEKLVAAIEQGKR